jgi:hypothetical protein
VGKSAGTLQIMPRVSGMRCSRSKTISVSSLAAGRRV